MDLTKKCDGKNNLLSINNVVVREWYKHAIIFPWEVYLGCSKEIQIFALKELETINVIIESDSTKLSKLEVMGLFRSFLGICTALHMHVFL